MNEWIACNLPWHVRLEWPASPPYPDMDAKIKEQFGATKAQWEEQFFPGLHTDGIQFLSQHPIFQEYEEIKHILEEEQGDEYSEEATKEKLQLDSSVAVQTVLAYRGIIKSINDWVESQPEVIAWMEESDKIWKAHKEAENKLSFCGQKLNQAGTVIEFEDDGELIQMMIGTINELGGSCDDCRGINDDTVILRYKILWNEPNS